MRQFSRFATLLGVAILLFSTIAANAAQQKYSLSSNRAADSVDRIDASLEVAGKVRVLDSDAELQDLDLTVLANLLYDERSLVVPISPKAPMQSIRRYERALAAIQIDSRETHHTLRDDHRVIAVGVDGGKATLCCPAGPLVHDELDLIDLQANTLVLDRFLPPYRIKIGDTWKHSDELLGVILGLDAVSSNRVESKLDSVTNSIALIEITGNVEGAVNGVSTEIKLSAKYQFDLTKKRITWFGLLVQEQRSVGHVSPGLNVVARLQMKIDSINESTHLTDDALAGLSLQPNEENTWLAYKSPEGGFEVLSDRRWYVTADEPKTAVLRMIDRGELVAQCNVSSLTQVEPDDLISIVDFQEDIEQGLGEAFGQFISAKQETNDSGYRVFRVEVAGVASEVPIQWVYYLLADQSGRQLVLVFVVEGELIERMAGADEQLVAATRFVDSTVATRPTPVLK